MTTQPNHDSRRLLRRASLWVVGLFWIVQFCELTIVSFVESKATAWLSLEPRALVFLAGVLLTLVFVEVSARLERRPFRQRLVLTVIAALGLCLVLITINFGVFYITFTTGRVTFDLTDYVYTAFSWSWFFISIAAAVLALSYNLDVQATERRLRAMEAVASEAQMAALRYQLNPHFLFNTLNSVAALVSAERNDRAELMVENLADFLRATLELDPLQDIPVSREIHLQKLYLAIEEVRFPTRLRLVFDLPDDLMDAMVPALITQPLVENAIRHAVARSAEPVTLRIAVARKNKDLLLVVEDDAKSTSQRAGGGTGVGLGNVKARLAARFATDQSVRIDRLAPSGFRVTLQLPLRKLQ